MTQLAVAWPPTYVGDQTWEREIDALRAAVRHLTPKEVAYALDVSATQLSDALYERERKIWHPRWTHVVKAMLAAEHTEFALELWRSIVESGVDGSPWTLVENEKLTLEEEAALLRSELARFGEAGKAAAAKVPKGRKR